LLAVGLVRGLVNRHCPTQPLFLQVRHWRLRVICPWLDLSTWIFTRWCELSDIFTSASLIPGPLICRIREMRFASRTAWFADHLAHCRHPAPTSAEARRVVKHGACQILASCILGFIARNGRTARAAETAEIRRCAARTWADAALGVQPGSRYFDPSMGVETCRPLPALSNHTTTKLISHAVQPSPGAAKICNCRGYEHRMKAAAAVDNPTIVRCAITAPIMTTTSSTAPK
jgi:hypothetical protein